LLFSLETAKEQRQAIEAGEEAAASKSGSILRLPVQLVNREATAKALLLKTLPAGMGDSCFFCLLFF
jgi:hypothetical protein